MILLVIYVFNEKWELLTMTISGICFLAFMKNFVYYSLHLKSHIKFKIIFFVDGSIHFCYILIFAGFTLYFLMKKFELIYIFIIPYVILGICLIFMNKIDNDYTGQKIFTVIEAIQFLLIALKLNDRISLQWNYI